MSETNLQTEVRKRHPFDSLEQEAQLNILRTNNLLMIRLERLFREHGISHAQYNILRILRGNRDGLSSHEIGQQMVTRVPDMTRLIDRLVKADLVERARSTTDRRVVCTQITKRGLQLLSTLDEPVLDAHRANLGHLSPEELQQINALMVRARAGVVDAD
ncbi:HTH-type transcriptional regulator MhqR [Maioricimonas rarisocia]|uniref:HTH-type transcriptional regulator MhqR n=1 Tax=Maioricimonas rarisocia TaxID=2528026 RepID=A0A517Z805_9PLAN|nr:MarR family transcriptional regulator [Maioricimonas rarisocia]QDU38604.1 HTH-type transcriptional regulator MhqR [Maioricimonas rarisocia]